MAFLARLTAARDEAANASTPCCHGCGGADDEVAGRLLDLEHLDDGLGGSARVRGARCPPARARAAAAAGRAEPLAAGRRGARHTRARAPPRVVRHPRAEARRFAVAQGGGRGRARRSRARSSRARARGGAARRGRLRRDRRRGASRAVGGDAPRRRGGGGVRLRKRAARARRDHPPPKGAQRGYCGAPRFSLARGSRFRQVQIWIPASALARTPRRTSSPPYAPGT